MRPHRELICALICALLCLAACATRQDRAEGLVRTADWQWNWLSAGTFDIASAVPPRVDPGKPLWIYIEGDGLAYISPDRPSSNPTPADPVALRMALAQGENAAWLARPCQYASLPHNRNCAVKYWTTARAAPEIVAALDQAVDELKKQTGAKEIILAGYSGGGAVAVLIAARRHDVAGIVTAAADLDFAYWTSRHGLAPLSGSLDPANDARAVAEIPQWHFVGEKDDVVEPAVLRSYAAHLPAGAPVKIIEVPEFTHECCWAEEWQELTKEHDPAALSR